MVGDMVVVSVWFNDGVVGSLVAAGVELVLSIYVKVVNVYAEFTATHALKIFPRISFASLVECVLLKMSRI